MNKKHILFLSIVLTISLILRFYGIFDNHPMWTDEYNTAAQGRVALQNGLASIYDPDVPFEYQNIIPHFLVAGSLALFKTSQEWVIRIPFVLIGSFVPIAVYFLARKLFDETTATIATLLSTFSYFMITWSRQARGYPLLQITSLMTLFMYLRIVEKKHASKKELAILGGFILTGILTHTTFYILLACIALHAAILWRKHIIQLKVIIPAVITSGVLFVFAYVSGLTPMIQNLFSQGAFGADNYPYYHSFLWREYGFITLLAGFGILFGLQKSLKKHSVVILFITAYLSFLSFVFKPYVTRYLLPLFPIIVIYASATLGLLGTQLLKGFNIKSRNVRIMFGALIALGIIFNGFKFVKKPQRYYSVNFDFREIAVIDYHMLYNFILEKGQLEKGETIVIDTWWDRTRWYLGYDFENIAIYRWGNQEEGTVNGLAKTTNFIEQPDGTKIIPGLNMPLVAEVDDLRLLMKKYPKGFLYIDDTSMPQDVQDFARDNLKLELEFDRYQYEINPYAVWPSKLYSWGFEEEVIVHNSSL